MVIGETPGDELQTPDVKLSAITADVMSRASRGMPSTTPEIVEGCASEIVTVQNHIVNTDPG
eukprot:5893672-Amphidinium_carterae.1